MHGMKWQTIDMPNGMNFHVYSPMTVRDNDLDALESSKINDKLVELQTARRNQYYIYGDSAYINITDSHIHARFLNPPEGEDLTDFEKSLNKTMSSCREIIEWDYGDIGKYWKLVDYKHALQIRKMPVAEMYLIAMLLRNAYNTMNGSNTCEYFNMIPPTFESWVSQGPAERRIRVVNLPEIDLNEEETV